MKKEITDQLITSLIEKRLMTHNTCITAHYKKSTDTGYVIREDDFALLSAYKPDADSPTVMKVRNENIHISITYENIILVDGMHPVDFAKAYNLKADGTKKNMGVRRGRPPKHKIKEFF